MGAKMGLLVGRLGIPGSGKSHFVRSAAALGKVWVALTDPQEAVGYPKLLAPDMKDGANLIEQSLYFDAEWVPFAGSFKAEAWGRLLKDLYALRERADIAVVALDSMTGASELASHDVRKLTRAGTLKEVGEYGLGYINYSAQLAQLLHTLKVLALGGKHVICTFHIAAKEQEGAGTGKLVNGELEFEDRMLPILERGRDVQSIAGHFPLWLYSSVLGTNYRVRSIPDNANPAKSRLAFDAKLAPGGACENDFVKVLAAIGWKA